MTTENIVYIYNMLKQNADQAIAKKEAIGIEYNQQREKYLANSEDGSDLDLALTDFLASSKQAYKDARMEADKALEALEDFMAMGW